MLGVANKLAARFRCDFADVEIDIEQLRRELAQLGAEGKRVVYVTRRPSALQLAILQRVCARLGLPQPAQIIKPGAPPAAAPLEPGTAEMLPLRDRVGREWTVRGSKRYRRKLREMLNSTGQSWVFVPVTFFSGLGPRPWLSPFSKGIDFEMLPLADAWLLFVYAVHREQLSIEIGPRMTADGGEPAADYIPRLFRELYRHEKLRRGAQVQTRETVESIVLSGEGFENDLFTTALEQAISRDEAYEIARRCYHEIAATISTGAITALYYLLRTIVNTVFAETEVHGIENLKRTAANYPTVVLPSHRSHFDYILVGWILYHEKISLPYVAAGDNLNFFPVGKLLRAAGAFFIRRRIGDDRLYKRVLDNYLSYLIKIGHLLAFYIEGGRSRSGSIRQPRLGLLKYLVRGWEQGTRDDLRFVPMGITYERVAEEASIFAERGGGTKEAESVFSLLKARRLRRRRFGSVIFSVGEPFSLKEFREHSTTLRREDQEQSTAMLTEDLGYAVARRIQRATVMTGTSLTAAAATSLSGNRWARAEVIERMQTAIELYWLQSGGDGSGAAPSREAIAKRAANMQPALFGGLLLKELQRAPLEQALGEILQQVCAWGYLRTGQSDRVHITPEQRLGLDYYKNGILHTFFSACVAVSVCGCGNAEATEGEVHRYHQLFKPWFLLPYWRIWRKDFLADCRLFRRCGLIATEGEEAPDAGDGFLPLRLTEEGRPMLDWLPRLLRPFFEVLITGACTAIEICRDAPLEEEFVAEVARNVASAAFLPGEALFESRAVSYAEYALQVLSSSLLVTVSRASDLEQASTGGRARSLAVGISQIAELETRLVSWRHALGRCLEREL